MMPTQTWAAEPERIAARLTDVLNEELRAGTSPVDLWFALMLTTANLGSTAPKGVEAPPMIAAVLKAVNDNVAELVAMFMATRGDGRRN